MTRGASPLDAARVVRELGADPVMILVVVDRGGTCGPWPRRRRASGSTRSSPRRISASTTRASEPRAGWRVANGLGGRHRGRYRRLMTPSHETPTAAFSIRIRVRLDNQPGDARAAGGGHRRRRRQHRRPRRLRGQARRYLDEDIIVNCPSEAHQAQVHRRAIRGARRHRGARVGGPHLRHARGRQDRGARRWRRSAIATTSRWPTRRAWPACATRSPPSPSWPTSSRSRRTRSPSSPTAPRCSAWATSARRPPCR